MSCLNSTSVTAGSAAEQALLRKEEKYAALALSHTFIPITIEPPSYLKHIYISFAFACFFLFLIKYNNNNINNYNNNVASPALMYSLNLARRPELHHAVPRGLKNCK